MFLSVSMTACRMSHFPGVNNGIQIRGKIIFFPKRQSSQGFYKNNAYRRKEKENLIKQDRGVRL